MGRTLKRFWMAMVMVAMVFGVVAAPASAGVTLTQINMSDTFIGGWTTLSNPGIFHLFVISGSDPNGTIINSGTDQPISIPLFNGTQAFTLLGNEGASSSFHNPAGATLYFSDGSSTASLQVSQVTPGGSVTLGTATLTVSNFTFTPYDLTGFNRVTSHFVGTSGPEGTFNDAIARFTLTTSSHAPSLTVPGPQAVNEGQALSFTVSATDPDAGQSVTITASGLPSGATFDGTTFSWTPTLAQVGLYTVSFTATDDGTPAESETKTVAITVGTPAISVSPTALSLNGIVGGTPGQQTFTVSNPGTAALTVSGITVGGADAAQFAVSPSSSFTITPGGPAQTFTVTFTPFSSGARSASLSLLHNAAGSPAVVSLSGTATNASPGDIITVAGTGTPGFSGDEGAAILAKLSSARSVAVDGSGNLYVADATNRRIRKVDTAGIITTVAGDTTAGFSGDGGPATSAKLNNPQGVAVDGSGNFYIADTINRRIRKVTVSTGIITTVAGNGTATFSGDGGSAILEGMNPNGVSVDGSGNLYISDATNRRIRKVTVSTGIITTVAGNGLAGSSGDGGQATSASLTPVSVSVDGSGNIYIAETSRVRKVTVSTGIITTVAGGGTLSGDGIPATSAILGTVRGVFVVGPGNLYLSDTSQRVRKVDATTGIITTVAGNGMGGFSGDGGPATSAQLFNPFGVAVDGPGNLYIADLSNQRIRKVLAIPAPAYSQSPSSLSFGSVSVGWSGAQTFTVSNPGTAALNVSGITVNGTDAGQFSASPSSFTVNPGGPAQTVTVTFSPASAGAKSASLSITHNAAGSPATVSLSGTALAIPDPPSIIGNKPLPDPNASLCLLYMDQDLATQYWWARATDRGTLDITLTAVSVNGSESGSVTMKVYDPSNVLKGTRTVAHPPGMGTEASAPVLSIPGAVDADLYRVEVKVNPPGSGAVARHYELELKGASMLGMNSPAQAEAEHEEARWSVNVLAIPPEALDVSVTGGPEAPATAGNVEVYNPSGALVTTVGIGTPIHIPSADAGMWTVRVTGANGHYIINKTSGVDRGVYATWMTMGEGEIAGTITQSGGPNATPVTVEVLDEAGTVVQTIPNVTGGYTTNKLGVGYYTVRVIPPPGFQPVASLAATVTCHATVGADFDLKPVPSISINDMPGADEANDPGQVNPISLLVSLSAPSADEVRVDYATANGTAVSPGDYGAVSGTLVFAPGETAKEIGIDVMGDGIYEGNENFFVNLTHPVNATISDAQGQVTILDVDAQPTVSINDVTVIEGNSGTKDMIFTVEMSVPSSQTVTVNFSTADETAKAGSDYVAQTGTVTFEPNGEMSKQIKVVINGDLTFETSDPDDPLNPAKRFETFFVNLQDPVNATILDGQAVGKVLDNDPAPSIAIDDVTVTEGNTGTVNATFTVSLSAAIELTVKVDFSTSDGTATAGTDYAAAGGTLTFNPGETSKTVTVTVNGDLTDEADETFQVNLSNPILVTISDSQGAGTIVDDDNPPSISINDVTVAEGNTGTTDAVFTVTLSNPSGQAVTVNFSTVDGTATAGTDYVSKAGTLTFNPGEASQTVTVVVTGDVTDEADETFSVNLTNPVNATLPGGTKGTGTITDDDATPMVSVNDVSVAEGVASTNGIFTVTLSNPSSQTVTVDFSTSDGTATAGTDYVSKVGALTFAPGVTSQTVTVVVTGDVADEADETFFVTLSNPTHAAIGDDTGVGTILDDDNPPSISINDGSVTEGNTGTVNATFTVTLTVASGKTVTVDYSTADGTAASPGDYASSSGTVTFAPGVKTQTLTVAVNGDATDELNETFFVNLSNPTNVTISDGQGRVTIVDDDAPPSISIDDVSVTEGNTGTTNAVFTVTLSNPSGQTVTVDYSTSDGTATAGSDYVSASGSLTFAPGVATQTVAVAVKGDAAFETDETFTVTLSNPANATVTDGTGIGTITNDDPQPTISINDVNVTEGNTGTTSAVFTVTLSSPSVQVVTVDFSTSDGTATAGSDYVLKVGTLTFNPGETTQTVTVVVNGDLTDEPDETFWVNLTHAVNATFLAGTKGTGTITDDDAPPSISINDVTATEGNTGTVNAVFTVTLSTPSGQTVTVNFSTSDGTAHAGSDYVSSSGTVTFAPGETSKSITVAVNGDLTDEPDETFDVTLSNPTNATLADGSGAGMITDDDNAPPISDASRMYISVHSGAASIQKGYRDEDVIAFGRDERGDVLEGSVVKFFDGSLYFKSNEQLDAVEVIDWDGDPEMELIFSVRSKANIKMEGLEIRPGDLILYNPSSTPKFTRFLDGSKVFEDYKNFCEKNRENIDGVALYQMGGGWKIALTATNKAKIGTLEFDKDDIVQVDYNPATKGAGNPVRLLDAATLFKGKQANLDAIEVVDDDHNGTFESIVFSTSGSEKLKDGRQVKPSVIYLYNRETDTVEELFDPKSDGLSKNSVQIGSVSTLGPLKPWGTGPRPDPAAKKAKKGQALLAKVGEGETQTPEAVPEAFGLDQSYPNPFNPSTTIRYGLPEASNVSLVVYNILGQQVRMLVSGAQGAGYHTVVWDGRDEAGRMAATGVYIYRLQAGTFSQVKKMILAK